MVVGAKTFLMIPADAQYYLPTNDGTQAALFYCVKPVKYNDGTMVDELFYYSSCGGGWLRSATTNMQLFIEKALVKIN